MRPIRITSLASGSAPELIDLLSSSSSPNLIATCVDLDTAALGGAHAAAALRNISQRMTFLRDDVWAILNRPNPTRMPAQNVIYSAGILDCLNDEAAARLIDWVYGRLLSGGCLILGTFMSPGQGPSFTNQLPDSISVCRTREAVLALFARSGFGSRSTAIRVDDPDSHLFAIAHKP